MTKCHKNDKNSNKCKKSFTKKGVSKGRIIKYILLVKIKDTTKQLYKRYNYEEHQYHQEHCQEL